MRGSCGDGNCNSRGDKAGELARSVWETSSDDADASTERETTGMLRRGCGWCSLSGGGQERSAGERHDIGGYEGYSWGWACGDETADDVAAGGPEDEYVA
jgi:hypothetical protein